MKSNQNVKGKKRLAKTVAFKRHLFDCIKYEIPNYHREWGFWLKRAE